MSGHSKWAKIKHKKADSDAKKGAVYTKLIKEITIAARNGGGNPEMNPSLRVALNRAKAENMPNDNVDRAVKRGTGELPGVTYETVLYEGYGLGGVAVMVESLTDNKNRTTAELRNIFARSGGNMAGAGSVAWMFTKKGLIIVEKTLSSEDDLLTLVLDAGAEDMKSDDQNYEITTSVQDFEKVKAALDAKNIKYAVAETTMIPSSTVKLVGSEAKNILGLVEALEEHEDTQNVYANFDIPDEILEEGVSE